jgi:hypothetical protein
MDLINQGKGPVAKIWGTTNEIILRECFLECKLRNINFYDPPANEVQEVKSLVMTEGA